MSADLDLLTAAQLRRVLKNCQQDKALAAEIRRALRGRLRKPCSLLGAKKAAYENRFGVALADRVQELLAQYPNVEAPNFLSWEGGYITGADTTSALRRLLAALES